MNHLGPSLRRRRYRSWTGWRLLAGVVASVLLNALVLWLVEQDWTKLKSFPTDGPRSVAMAPLSPDAWSANRQVTDGSRPAPPPQAPPRPQAPQQRTPAQQQPPAQALAAQQVPPPPPQLPGQVVDVAPTNTDKPPKDTRFLAESNNSVEKESISRLRQLDYKKAAPMPTQNQAKPQAPGEKGQQAAQDTTAGSAGGDTRKAGAPGRMPEAAPKPSPDKLAMAVSPDGQISSKERPVDPGTDRKKTPLEELGEGGQGGEGAAKPGISGGKPILTPSTAFYDKLTSAPAPDHVEGVDVGDATFLNTREWKYAGFFNRVKQNVAEVWNPMDAARVRDPTGSRYFNKDRTTILSVTLNPQGSIAEIKVARSSGLDFLDQTAIDAFEKAQPFVNPPPGLADSRGFISFTFGFHVATGGGGFRFSRGPGQ
ncbi:MAG: TonB family protein [Deltaproteobacteria bacterium]